MNALVLPSPQLLSVCSVDSMNFKKLNVNFASTLFNFVHLGNSGFQLEADMVEDRDILLGITEKQSK